MTAGCAQERTRTRTDYGSNSSSTDDALVLELLWGDANGVLGPRAARRIF